jgi:hypothetical protein
MKRKPSTAARWAFVGGTFFGISAGDLVDQAGAIVDRYELVVRAV